MKPTLPFILSLTFIYPQSNYFNIVSGNSREIIHASSLWLSGTPMINPMAKNRFFLEIGSSLTFLAGDRYKYPNRYSGVDQCLHRDKNLCFLEKLNSYLKKKQITQLRTSYFNRLCYISIC